MPTFFQMLPPHTTAKLFTFVCLLIQIDIQSIYHSSYEEAEGFSLSSRNCHFDFIDWYFALRKGKVKICQVALREELLMDASLK